MKKNMLGIASMIAMAAAPVSAQADVIAGWDFSQYFTAGRLTIDGTNYVDTLAANYSSLDPTFNAGGLASSEAGKMFMDGTAGSSSVDPSPGNATVVPTPRKVGDYGTAVADIPTGEGAVQSNSGTPGSTLGSNPFNAFSILRTEGQVNTQHLALLANASASVAFLADATVGAGSAENWSVSFGGRALQGGAATVGVAFAPNCGSYGSVTNVNLTEDDQAFTVVFPGANNGATGCVRMDLSSDAIIDNVAIEATPLPEPGAVLGLGAGFGLLAMLRRRRV